MSYDLISSRTKLAVVSDLKQHELGSNLGSESDLSMSCSVIIIDPCSLGHSNAASGPVRIHFKR